MYQIISIAHVGCKKPSITFKVLAGKGYDILADNLDTSKVTSLARIHSCDPGKSKKLIIRHGFNLVMVWEVSW